MAGKSTNSQGILKTDKSYIAVLKFSQPTDRGDLVEAIENCPEEFTMFLPDICGQSWKERKVHQFELIELVNRGNRKNCLEAEPTFERLLEIWV